MKKLFVGFVSVVLCVLFTACSADEFEPTNQLAKTGKIEAVSAGVVTVNVGGDLYDFDGDGYTVGESVRVFFDTNGDPTNPWVWWVIDCKPLK